MLLYLKTKFQNVKNFRKKYMYISLDILRAHLRNGYVVWSAKRLI
jgi:hypothetical protein